jgi:small subunit ribosomal protein S15
MSLSKEERSKLIASYRVHDGDSGSPEVQIALLTEDIRRLTEHMKQHRKDYHPRQGLLKKVNRQKKLLAYLNRFQHDRYLEIVKRLGLRQSSARAQGAAS